MAQRSMRCLIVVLIVASLNAAHAIAEDCCICKDSRGVKFGSPIPSGLGGDCKITCAANQGSFVGRRGGPCVTPPLGNLKGIAKYCVFHQGANVWAGRPDNNEILSGEALRRALMGVQTDFLHGQEPSYRQLEKANLAELEQVAGEAVRECVGERNLRNDILWVWGEKAQKWDMWDALQRGDYTAIRSIFSNTQAHDDNLRNRIYCLSGSEIAAILNSFGNPGPRPQPPATSTAKPTGPSGDRHPPGKP
jgi:hypothetical protein